MEYLEGITLKELIKKEERIPEEVAVRMMMPIIKLLKALHSDGIIHRDISPDNIFLCNNGNIKLIGFSVAKFYTNDNRAIVRTTGYSPIEQYYFAGKIGPWSDVYALGATMYRMITGVKPEESTERKMRDTLVPPKALAAII